MAFTIKRTNKKTGITYVYESESYWDKEKKQPRSRRKLIGKIDEKTGEIVPTGKQGKRGNINGDSEPNSNLSDKELKSLCDRQAAAIKKKDEEILTLKEKVSELTSTVNEYRKKLLKIGEVSRF